jgi:hypothetical protein
MAKRKTIRSRFATIRRTGCGVFLFMVVAIVALAAILVFAFTNVLDPLGQNGNAFMTALKNEQYDAAYALTSKAFEAQYNADEFATNMQEFTNPPTKWSFASFSVFGSTGRIIGRATFDGQEYNLTIYFVYEDGGWAVNGFDFGIYQQTDLVPTPAPTVPPSH